MTSLLQQRLLEARADLARMAAAARTWCDEQGREYPPQLRSLLNWLEEIKEADLGFEGVFDLRQGPAGCGWAEVGLCTVCGEMKSRIRQYIEDCLHVSAASLVRLFREVLADLRKHMARPSGRAGRGRVA